MDWGRKLKYGRHMFLYEKCPSPKQYTSRPLPYASLKTRRDRGPLIHLTSFGHKYLLQGGFMGAAIAKKVVLLKDHMYFLECPKESFNNCISIHSISSYCDSSAIRPLTNAVIELTSVLSNASQSSVYCLDTSGGRASHAANIASC